MKFEDALARLEEIVEELEKGELSLDETLQIFEEGIRMSKICSQKLNEAELKVEKLVEISEEGELQSEPFIET